MGVCGHPVTNILVLFGACVREIFETIETPFDVTFLQSPECFSVKVWGLPQRSGCALQAFLSCSGIYFSS